jgi:long-chain acyl-CoA synthetase
MFAADKQVNTHLQWAIKCWRTGRDGGLTGTSERRPSSANVADDLARTAAASPAAAALFFGPRDARWSFEHLEHEAQGVAGWLRAKGIGSGDRVVLVMENWPEHVAGWYGILAAGAVVVDVNFIVQDEEWKHILEDSEPSAIIGGSPFRSRLERLAAGLGDVPVLTALDRGAGWDVDVPRTDAEPVAGRAGNDVAVISYTSGTTGLPKGVVHTHERIAAQLDLLTDVQAYRAGDVVYQAIPLFAIHAFLPVAASAVRNGAAVVLADRFDAAEMSRASQRFGITYMTLSPPMLDAIMSLPEDELPTFPALRLLTAGGAPLQPETRARFEELIGVPVTQGFGMTEIMGVLVADYEGDAPWGSSGRVRPIGSPHLVVVDDDGAPLPADGVGEFAVHRTQVLVGYWGRPDLYEAAFVRDWFLTGDIGRIDADGFVHVLDRKKDMIIRGGFNIYSAEIERVLSEHPAVAEATVVGAPDERLGEVPVAFVVARFSEVDADAVQAELLETTRSRLGSLKSPVWIRVVGADDLPRNTLRKVQKGALRDSLRASG